MPRGVYNRAKMKKAGRPAKTEVKAKRKYTRRNIAENDVQEVVQAVESSFTQHAESPALQGQGAIGTYELTSQLERLGSITTSNAALRGKIDEIMLVVSDKLLIASKDVVKTAEAFEKAPKAPKAAKAPKIEEAPEAVKAEASEEKNGKHTVLPAPVPFLAVPISS